MFQLAIANDLTIEEILNNQDKYAGKEVSVTGILYTDYEGAFIHDDKGNYLWLGVLPPDADISNIHESYGSMTRVKGKFHKDEPGIFHFSEGIGRISLVEPLQKEKIHNRLGYDLQAIIEVDGNRYAMLVDFPTGKGFKAETGDNIRGLFEKKIISILKDRLIIEEKCPQCIGEKTRRFEILVRDN